MSTAEARWQARIDRARHLAARHPEAREPLAFYAALAAAQAALLKETDQTLSNPPRLGGALARFLPAFADRVARDAPSAVAARLRMVAGESGWEERLETYWASGGRLPAGRDPVDCFLAEALLQPVAEAAALAQPSGGHASPAAAGPAACPVCTALPLVGLLREAGHGARRSLLCGLCLSEWPALRLVCAACGEARFDQLPVYRADDLAAVRVDACDSCRAYVKTLDLTRDGAAEPVVDDVATLALDLWAREQGYRRVRANVLWI